METNLKSLNELIELIKQNKSFKIKVKVIANSKVNLIDFGEDFIKIKITQRAIEGKANKAIIEFLSKTLSTPKSKIEIVSGEKSSVKIIKIL